MKLTTGLKALIVLLFIPIAIIAKNPKNSGSYVDKEGVIRWRNDNSEIVGFGVNYSTPFAHAFRMAEAMGISHKEAIQQDVYHMARLGLDIYRVHVWDTEISDSIGNLLINEHLDLFDYTISEMKKRGMHFVITPIAFWGNGWPEPDYKTSGFSNKYGKDACLCNPEAIKAQENYLYQFLNHVNPYTSLAYKNDPDIIAFEVSNEPHHSGSEKHVTNYINRMVKAMRKTGTTTPILYNMSHSIHLIDAYLNSNAQGGTFQWYPTNLVANRQLNGNFLPQVNSYHIPFQNNPKFQKSAKIVYEFDPADVGGNYMYPAMARSFRTAGMQLATHFDYDAMFLAAHNTNYGTHYMSLPYAPKRALSLKIASAVFHQIPRYKDFGNFPENNYFDNFKIDYSNDLVEMLSYSSFYYSNNTSTKPDKIELITEIAGYGSSPLIQYDGKGAYFLDKIGDKVWRLEVMPDAHLIGDPFAKTSPERQVAAVTWQERSMTIALPELGGDFKIEAINNGNSYNTATSNGTFDITPGVYIVQPQTGTTIVSAQQRFKNIAIGEFVAPEANLKAPVVINKTAETMSANSPTRLCFEVISEIKPIKVEVQLSAAGNRPQLIDTKYAGADNYIENLSNEQTACGVASYNVVLSFEDGSVTFPAGKPGHPGNWDYYDDSNYRVEFIPDNSPLLLWDARKDYGNTIREWMPGNSLKPLCVNDLGLNISMDSLPSFKHYDSIVRDYTFKYFCKNDIAGRRNALSNKSKIVVAVSTTIENPQPLEIGLITANGIAFTAEFQANTGTNTYKIPLEELKQGKYIMVKRPYPEFMPYYHESEDSFELNLKDIETIQFSIKQGLSPNIDLTVAKIWLE